MFEFSEKEIIQKIIDEMPWCSPFEAGAMARGLTDINPMLQPCAEAWVHNRIEHFEYNGLSLEHIMKKEQTTYLGAIFRMSSLLAEPGSVQAYIDMPIIYE